MTLRDCDKRLLLSITLEPFSLCSSLQVAPYYAHDEHANWSKSAISSVVDTVGLLRRDDLPSETTERAVWARALLAIRLRSISDITASSPAESRPSTGMCAFA